MTGPDRIAELTLRVAEAERESQRVRRFGTVLMAAGAVVLGAMAAITLLGWPLGLAAFVPSVVQAKQFVIRDTAGRQRGIWGVTEDGAAQIFLSDSAGRPRLRLRVFGDGSSGLSLLDGANQPRLVAGLLPDQSTTLVLADEAGKTRGVFGLTPAGATTILFADRGGVTKAGLGVDSHGLGTFTLTDRSASRVEDAPESGADDQAADSGAGPNRVTPPKSH